MSSSLHFSPGVTEEYEGVGSVQDLILLFGVNQENEAGDVQDSHV